MIHFQANQKKVYDALTSPEKYILFTEEEGGKERCQTGALSLSNQRIFDWQSHSFCCSKQFAIII
jgi:hypothetical protein